MRGARSRRARPPARQPETHSMRAPLCRFQPFQWASRVRITSFGRKHDLPVQLLVALLNFTSEQGISLGRNRVTHRLPILIPENSLKARKQIGFLLHHVLAVVD